MQLKTYRATTMAQALVEIKKDLGSDAVILHTRQYKDGGLLGIGGKPMVEITASGGASKPAGGGGGPNGFALPGIPAPGSVPKVTPDQLAERIGSIGRIEKTAAGTYTAAAADSIRQVIAEARAQTGQPPEPKAAPKPRPEFTLNPEPKPTPRAESPRPAPITPAPNPMRIEPKPIVNIEAKPDARSAQAGERDLESEVASLKRMMGQVLQAQHTGERGSMTGPLLDQYTKLIDNDVEPSLADELAGQVRDELTVEELGDAQIVRETLLRRIEDVIPTRNEAPVGQRVSGSPRVVALIGPTGVGKTTTVSKLAAAYKLRYRLNVGLITADTYRIAAVDQLKVYADIIELPMEVAETPGEMRLARERLSHCDVIVVDSAGRSQNDAAKLAELRNFLDAASPDETHLVLSSTSGERALGRIADRFMALRPDRMIITKLDEAITTGVLAGLPRRIGLPISFVTTGQEVPDDIEPARAARLARMILAGPDA